MQNLNEGLLFDPALSAEIKDRFYYVDADPEFGQRLFFENSGGSLRLKASVEAQAKYQAFPDCPERLHDRSRALKKVQLHGIDDIMHIVFGASGGALISEMTASQAMFQIVGAILENCPGKSAVTSVLEHPSAYDAVKYYCDKTGKEFRVAQANPKTGGIDSANYDQADDGWEEREREIRAFLTGVLADHKGPWEFRYLAGRADRALTHLARAVDASTIMVGAKHPSGTERLREFVSGSVALRLSRHQHRPVVIVPLAVVDWKAPTQW